MDWWSCRALLTLTQLIQKLRSFAKHGALISELTSARQCVITHSLRYELGEVVCCVDLMDATPCLSFLGERYAVSDLCGEKLNLRHITRALKSASAMADEAELRLISYGV